MSHTSRTANQRRASSWLGRVWGPAVVALGTVTVAALAVLLPAGRAAAPVLASAPTTQSLVCSVTSPNAGQSLVAVDGASSIDVGPIGETASAGRSPVTVKVTSSQVITGASPTAGGVYSTSGSKAQWNPCQQASSSSVLQVLDPSTSTLVLTNPDANAVSVDLTLISDQGDVTTAGARGIAVGSHSTRAVPLSVLAAAGHPLAVVVKTDQGRVAASIQTTSTTMGLTTAASSVTATSSLIAGIPAKAASVKLILTNTSTSRATATVTALVGGGSFVPEGGSNVAVDSQDTITLDLTGPLDGQAAGLAVSSDQPLSVTGYITTASDAASVPGVTPVTDQIIAVPAAGTLELSNPGASGASVTVVTSSGSQVVAVAAGNTEALEVGAGAVRVTSTQPVVAAVAVGTAPALAIVTGRASLAAQTPVPVQHDPGLR